MEGSVSTFPWALVIIGGPVLLFVVAFWAWRRSRKADDQIDPNTDADDPSKGMPGHD